MKLQLFALIAKQPAFHQLRSVEQLGYITVLMQRFVKHVPPHYHSCMDICPSLQYLIFTQCRNDSGIRGVQFIIQSTVKVYSVALSFYNVDPLPNPHILSLNMNRVLEILIWELRHFSRCLRVNFMRWPMKNSRWELVFNTSNFCLYVGFIMTCAPC